MASRLIREEPCGAMLYQVTDDPANKSNIYCEDCYCPLDSKSFVFERSVFGKRMEIVRCEFGSWEQTPLGLSASRPAMTHTGMMYFLDPEGTRRRLIRFDIGTGKREAIFEFEENGPRAAPRIAVSVDERYMARGVAIGFDPQMFGVELFDLRSGERSIVHRDPYICNPHTQFEPSEGRLILIQHNRGCEYLPNGQEARRTGPEGVTLFSIDARDGAVARFQIGPPFTLSTTGHECWIGATKTVLVSTRSWLDPSFAEGNLYVASPSAAPRLVTKEHELIHVNADPSGRFFAADDRNEKTVVVGSIRTGKAITLCRTETSYRAGQPSHAHPYFSRDRKWVVMNSDRTGRTEIHAASVPEGLLEELDRME